MKNSNKLIISQFSKCRIFAILLISMFLIQISCTKELNVLNPNDPSIVLNVTNESGLTKYATGVVYINGFSNGANWLGDSYFSLPRGYSEIMAEVLHGGSGSNNQVNTIGAPLTITFPTGNPAGKVLTNPSPQVQIIRAFNNRAASSAGNNPLLFQWLLMYALNKGCNDVLALVDKVTYSGEEATKKNVFRAWCNFWKGYAYSQIGTLYYAGLKNNVSGELSNQFVSYKDIIAESNKFYKEAITNLTAATNAGAYSSTITALIPSVCQVGKGLAPDKDMWIRNINTLLARNILLNKLAPFVNGVSGGTINKSVMDVMSTQDWTDVKTYTTTGIKQTDYVFTGRAPEQNSFFTPNAGSCNANAAGSNTGTTLKVSERITQDFNPQDLRYIKNFDTSSRAPLFSGSGINATTKQSLIAQSNALVGVVTLGSKTALVLEIYIAGTYEENELMLGEANIYLGSIGNGITSINNVRRFQGAGLADIVTGSLTKDQALAELVRERRVALMLRGLSYFDMRRWGWSYSIANGGGRYNCVVYDGVTKYTNAKIDYSYMDYWDVPGDETELNKPAATSFAVKNPNY